jgi:hypothetical protein
VNAGDPEPMNPCDTCFEAVDQQMDQEMLHEEMLHEEMLDEENRMEAKAVFGWVFRLTSDCLRIWLTIVA